MKFVVRKADVLDELQRASGVVNHGGSVPALRNVLLEARDGRLYVSATDLDVSLRGSCPAQVVGEGAITLPAKKTLEIVKALPLADVTLTALPDAWASIECERTAMKLAGLPADDFPALPQLDGDAVDLPAATLAELIARTSFAVTESDARYYLAGALMVISHDSLTMVASDGHRLSYAQAKVEIAAKDSRTLVPRKALAEIVKLADGQESIRFSTNGSHLVFAAGERTLSSKSVEGQFPAYEKVIGINGDKVASVKAADLRAAVRRVALLSSTASRAVRVSLGGGQLSVEASSPELGQADESLTVDYDGESVSVGFNADYITDFLGVVPDGSVTIKLQSDESQGVMTADGDVFDHRYIIMPMRL